MLSNVARHIRLDADECEYFYSLLKEKRYKKRQFLLQEGEICRHLAFVTRGCMRSYSTDANGFDHVLMFAPADWWIGDMFSYITQQPGSLKIEAIEETDVLLLSAADREKLFVKVPKFERFFRIITERSLIAQRQRTLENLTFSAQERYTQFCKRYPTLSSSLPQKYVAAYIGVTPEFLSKMKGELGRKS